jgi:hypothetical protein
MKAPSTSISQALLVAACVAALVIGTSHTQVAAAQGAPASAPCNTVGTAVIGAIAGGILGKLTHHNNVVKGAAIGGAVGALACVAINYQSHRTESAQQMRQANPQFQPNPQVAVTNYQVMVQPGNVQAGQSVMVATNIGVLAGTQENIQNVSVQYDLIDTNGNVQKTFTKPVSDVQPDGGTYQSTVTFTPPAGVPHGTYAVRADLLINGQARNQQQGLYTVI